MNTKKPRNRQVDGLKGIAMLMVMLYHFMYRYAEIYSPGNDLKLPLLGKWGIAGVTIFLVVSGYFMAQERTGGFAVLTKKIFRLWPVYVAGITLCFTITRFLPLPGRTVSFGDYLLNIPFINGFIGTSYVDRAHWYITDLIGCALAYSIANTARSRKARIALKTVFAACSVMLGLVIKDSDGSSVLHVLYSLMGSGRLSMVFGGEAIMHLNGKEYKEAAYFEILAVVLCSIEFSILYTAVMIAAQTLLWLAANEVLKPLSAKPLYSVGEASYSIYVFHQNIGFIIIYYVSKAVGSYSLLTSVAVYAIMIAWGLLVYRYFEIPSRKWLASVLKEKKAA